MPISPPYNTVFSPPNTVLDSQFARENPAVVSYQNLVAPRVLDSPFNSLRQTRVARPVFTERSTHTGHISSSIWRYFIWFPHSVAPVIRRFCPSIPDFGCFRIFYRVDFPAASPVMNGEDSNYGGALLYYCLLSFVFAIFLPLSNPVKCDARMAKHPRTHQAQ